MTPAAARAWIFQATPRSRDLAADLQGTESLSWSVVRHGRDLHVGDTVYYWQAGRDAGIYGVGRVEAVSSRGPDGRYPVRTAHAQALFAPLTRAELRADPVTADLAVLRQPRGTVFALTPTQTRALARRVGAAPLLIAVPAGRLPARALSLRLTPETDGDVPALAAEAHARGDDIAVVLLRGRAVVDSAPGVGSGADAPSNEGDVGPGDIDGSGDIVATRIAVRDVRPEPDGAWLLWLDRKVGRARDVTGDGELGDGELGDGVDDSFTLTPVMATVAPGVIASGAATILPQPLPAPGSPPVAGGPPMRQAAKGTRAEGTRAEGTWAEGTRAEGARVAEEVSPYAPAAQRPRFAPTAEELYDGLVLPPSVAAQLVAAIDSGRHVVLMGIPGTGKTTLALALARAAARAGLCRGPLLATATADWTTFDTVGGLIPSADGALRFSEGVALRALRENRWLVLDELNRADIDKAFGPLLTVLSGAPVDLPTVMIEGRPVRVEPGPGPATFVEPATYRAGGDWRIVATMNTLDRAALFSFSLAFARRFAFILVPPPDAIPLIQLARQRGVLEPAAVALLERVLAATPRPLGPAVILDAAGYIAARGDPAALAEAVGLFVLPQMEGLDAVALDAFLAALDPLLDPEGAALLRQYVEALFG